MGNCWLLLTPAMWIFWIGKVLEKPVVQTNGGCEWSSELAISWRSFWAAIARNLLTIFAKMWEDYMENSMERLRHLGYNCDLERHSVVQGWKTTCGGAFPYTSMVLGRLRHAYAAASVTCPGRRLSDFDGFPHFPGEISSLEI